MPKYNVFSRSRLDYNDIHSNLFYMSFPPPPNSNRSSKAQAQAAESLTIDPFPAPPEPEDPRMKDEQILEIFRRTLRRDQIDDPQIIKFILAWVVTRSNPDSAEAAGFKRGTGSYWRGRPEIHKAIEEITAIAVVKHGYDASEMIERAKEIATLDPIEFQNPDGSFKTHLSEIRPEARRAIKKFRAKNIFGVDNNGMKIVIGQMIDVEVWDKLKGIELLGSEKNIFKKTTVVQHDVTSNMSELLLGSEKRAEERKLLMSRDVTGGSNGLEQAGHNHESRRDGGGVSEPERGGEGREIAPADDIEIVSGQDAELTRDEG